MRHLYVSDLDGTLLGSDCMLSSRSRRLLNQTLDQGALITVASARSIHSLKPLLPGLRLRLPVIEFNGAFISDFETGRHEVVHGLEPSVADKAFEFLAAETVVPMVSSYDGEKDSVYYGDPANDGTNTYLKGRVEAGDPRMQPAGDPGRHLDEQVVCLTVIDHRERLERVAPRIRERFRGRVQMHCFPDLYQPPWWWLTLHSPQATKAAAISDLLKRCSLEADALVAFGDQSNDLSMFEIAGLSVAVENAIDEVKARAHHVIGSNDDDSVARYIAEHARTRLRSPDP